MKWFTHDKLRWVFQQILDKYVDNPDDIIRASYELIQAVKEAEQNER